MRERGTVIELRGEKAVVESGRKGACKSCDHKHFCFVQGTDKIRIEAVNETSADIGDAVLYETHPSNYVLSAFLLYIFPLIFLFAGYFVSFAIFHVELLGIVGSFLFGASSFFFIRLLENHLSKGRAFSPVIIKVLRSPGDGNDE